MIVLGILIDLKIRQDFFLSWFEVIYLCVFIILWENVNFKLVLLYAITKWLGILCESSWYMQNPKHKLNSLYKSLKLYSCAPLFLIYDLLLLILHQQDNKERWNVVFIEVYSIHICWWWLACKILAEWLLSVKVLCYSWHCLSCLECNHWARILNLI